MSFASEATILVEAGFSDPWTSGWARFGSAIVGTSQIGSGEVFTPIHDYVVGITVDRQLSQDTLEWSPGRCTIRLNNYDGRFSPENASGPYVSAGESTVRPGIPVRVAVQYGAVRYHIFRGYVQNWRETWDVAAQNDGVPIVTLACTDCWASLARRDVEELAVAVGSGESSGARIHRILDAADFGGDRQIAGGEITMASTTLGGNAAGLLNDVRRAEGGFIYVDHLNQVTAASRFCMIASSRSNTVQVTFGDDSSAGEVQYTDPILDFDVSNIINQVSWSRTGGDKITATDELSVGMYDLSADIRDDIPIADDIQLENRVDWEVVHLGVPRRQLSEITVNPRKNPSAMFAKVLNRRILDLVRVKREHPGGFSVSEDCFITGLGYTITPDDMRVSFSLLSATTYEPFMSSKIGTAVVGTAVVC